MGKFIFGLIVGTLGTTYLIGQIIVDQKELYDTEIANLKGELKWGEGKNKEA